SGLSQLKKRAPHPDQPSTAAGGIDDCVRQGPAQLLSQFQAQRLLALDAVGFAKRRDVERSGSRRQLARGTSAIADVTVDEAQFCAEGPNLCEDGPRRRGRSKDRGWAARPGGVGGERDPGVSRRGDDE